MAEEMEKAIRGNASRRRSDRAAKKLSDEDPLPAREVQSTSISARYCCEGELVDLGKPDTADRLKPFGCSYASLKALTSPVPAGVHCARIFRDPTIHSEN